jgi:hypothetical protein
MLQERARRLALRRGESLNDALGGVGGPVIVEGKPGVVSQLLSQQSIESSLAIEWGASAVARVCDNETGEAVERPMVLARCVRRRFSTQTLL